MTLLLDAPASPRLPLRRPGPRRPPSLLPTSALLASGGDARITVDPATGRNRYLCPPAPEADAGAFGSSTASTISETGFAAAESLRQQLEHDLNRTAPSILYAAALERMRAELAMLCGIGDLPGLAIAFAASGTDLHLLAAEFVLSGARTQPLAVMIDPAETGSFVPAALAGRHFAGETAHGAVVTPGDIVAGRSLETIAIAVRDAEGMPRPIAAIDAEAEAVVTAAAGAGRRVLLTLADVSKTGIVAPSPSLAVALRRRFPDHVELLVDACQFRLGIASLRAYLKHGFIVAVTGSKFLTGPAFAGTLLIPDEAAARLRPRRLSGDLSAYAVAAELPAGWAAADALKDGANFGLLLRWEAALAEFRLFHQVPDAATAVFLERFAAAVSTRIGSDPAMVPLPVPAPDRLPAPDADAWDRIPTIFPFLLRHPGTGRLLTRAETEQAYRKLAALTPSHQVGQPVGCGAREGQSLAALRLCASARHVVEAALCGADRVIARALATLDTVREVAFS